MNIDWGSHSDYTAIIKRDIDGERWKALAYGSFEVKRPTIVVCRSKTKFNEFVAFSGLENAVCVTGEQQLDGLQFRKCEFILLEPPTWWTREWDHYVTRNLEDVNGRKR